MLNLFSFRLISSHRSFSWKLLTASHCHRSLCLPSHLNSPHVLSPFFHRISPHPISCLLSRHDCSLLFSCHLSFSHLFSSQLLPASPSFSQIFVALLNSSPLHCGADLTMIRPRTCSATVRWTSFPIHLPGHVLSCKT